MSLEDNLVDIYDQSDNNDDDDFLKSLSSQDRYKDLEKISSGGMKTIYKAFDERSQRYVAYAQLNKEASDVLNEVFINEARLTAKLTHPNIIPVYDVGTDSELNPYFTMELKSGDSLEFILSKLSQNDKDYQNQYTQINLLNIFLKVCDAISYAHHHKVLHLDLKPDNIQVGLHGEVMVCDWGLSKVFDQQTDTLDINQILIQPDILNSASLHGEIKGTPGYMAPEQIKQDSIKTPQTDIYALGCLLYKILSYREPITGDLTSVLSDTQKGNYQQLSSKEYPLSLVAVSEKAMSLDPKQRYSSISELQSEVKHYLLGYATHAENAGAFTLIKLFTLRNKVLSTTITLAFMTSLLFINKIIEEKNSAEENLRLLKEQRAETKAVTVELNSTKINHLLDIYNSEFYESPVQSYRDTLAEYQKLISIKPDSIEIKGILGYLYFIDHKFDLAFSCLHQKNTRYNYLLPYIEKYGKINERGALLKGDDFLNLLTIIEPYSSLHLKMLLYYSNIYSNSQAKIIGVKILLKKLNPNWNEKNFIYDKNNQKLTLVGNNISNLGDEQSPLKAIPIKALDLSGTGIKNLKALESLSISHLNISDLQLPSRELKRFKILNLDEITLSKGQYTDSIIQELKAYSKVNLK